MGADAPLIIGRPDQKGSTGRDNRMFVEGVLWIVRTGSPWRDLPEVFGDWNSVFRRFSRWSRKGIWWRIFEAMSDDPDFEYLIVDSTIVRAHQHAAGAKKGGLKIRRKISDRPLPRRPEHQDPHGRPRPGMSRALHPHRRPEGRCAAGRALIEGLPAEVVMADTAYDADHFRQAIAAKGALAVIPNNPSRALKHPLDKHLYAQRHLVECCFSSSNSSDASPPASKRPRETTSPSSPSPQSFYGCASVHTT